jgi:DNA-binding NtrC family response regulator
MKKRILIVDDDTSVRESLRKVLTETGFYEVTVASDGLEGEAILKSEPVDLLVLDLNMPNRDGWDVLGSTTAETPLLPVVLITGMYDQLDTTMIPGVGALMKKPIDVPPLLETIEELLAKSVEERLSNMGSGGHFEPWIRVTSSESPIERQSCD